MNRNNDFDAHRYLHKTRHRPPQRRSTDRDYRPALILLVAVAMGAALWWTL